MKSLLRCLLTLAVCATALAATDSPPTAAPNRFVLTKVRLLPKPGTGEALVGARVTGSLEGPTTAFVELAKITQAPTGDGWLEVTIPPGKVYRYVKFESAKGKAAALTEIEFFSPAGKLSGKPFGTSVPKDKAEHAFAKAFDGDPATYFEAPTDNSYAGLDLGREAQAPTPHFKPAGGAFAKAQRVELGVWPSGATIRYTTDGAAPTATSTLYRGPFTVASNTTVAATAFQDGLADSDVEIVSYVIGATVASAPPLRTYHIGNSLTDTVNGFLSVVANSAGKNLYYMRKTIPGCGITGNWKTCGQGFASPEGWANDYQVVLGKKVDHLFLQPFPNPPGLDDDTEYGGHFIALAREHNPAVQPWLYAQWPALPPASWKTDAHCSGAGWMKPPWFPPHRQPASWEEATANKMLYYLELLKRWITTPGQKPVRLCPGGPALVRLKRAIEAGQVPGFNDFAGQIFSDDIHLARPGRYLVALVHFACIYGETPENKVTIANSGLTREQAAIFQRLAWETVTSEPLSGVR